jgi:hypothetical protein
VICCQCFHLVFLSTWARCATVVNGLFAFRAQNPPARQIPAVVELSLFVTAMVRSPITRARFGRQSGKLFWKYCAGESES